MEQDGRTEADSTIGRSLSSKRRAQGSEARELREIPHSDLVRRAPQQESPEIEPQSGTAHRLSTDCAGLDNKHVSTEQRPSLSRPATA